MADITVSGTTAIYLGGSAGLTFPLAGSSGVAFTIGGTSQYDEGCETAFVPTPAIPADRDSIQSVYFQGPWAAPTVTVRLPRPELGDQRVTAYSTQVKHMQDGSVFLYRRHKRDVRLTLRFPNLSRKKALEFEAFLDTTAGDTVRFVDWESRVWRGHLIASPAEFIQTSRPEYGGEISVAFEGVNV